MVPLDILTKCHHKIWKCHRPFFYKMFQIMPWFNISFQLNAISVSANDPILFLMMPLDIQTKCHHKIWKCHQPFFHKKLQVMPWFNISFQPNATSVFLQMIPDFFLMVPLDILTKCHHKIWKCHQPFFIYKCPYSHTQFSAKCHQCVFRDLF